MTRLLNIILSVALVLAGSVAEARSTGPAPGTPDQIAALAAEIRALDARVDPAEALRAAQVTYDYTYQLAQEYQITDGPLIHNSKVNMGLRPRGLCWHWAEDIETRLKRENFKTLEMHRAVANSFNIRLEHSTAIISFRGEDFTDGLVLDPWRKGGVLFYAPVLEDRRYVWIGRDEVLAKKRVLAAQSIKRSNRSAIHNKQKYSR